MFLVPGADIPMHMLIYVDTLALFGSASDLLLRGVFVESDTGKLTKTAPAKRGLDSDFNVEPFNATAAVDIDALLARAAVTMGKEGRRWTLPDRLGRRND
jgi:hypothetical protein